MYMSASNAKTDLFRLCRNNGCICIPKCNLNSSNGKFVPYRLQFCTLLAGIFLLEIIGGIMGYVMRAQVADIAETKMMDTMPKYNDSREIQIVWDELQRNVQTRN